MNENVMGFVDLPVRKYIFIGGSEEGEQNPYGWYSLNADGSKQGHPHFGLRGKIVALKMVKKEFKGKVNIKLDIWVNADRPYAVRSGISTTFTRGIVLALHQYMVDTGEVDEPFTIGIKVGEADKVIFSSLFNHEDKFCKSEWDRDIKLGPMIHEIQSKLGQDLMVDNCVECQPKESKNPPAKIESQKPKAEKKAEPKTEVKEVKEETKSEEKPEPNDDDIPF